MIKKQCVQCSKTFQIDESDRVFYSTMQVPSPTLCPDCRFQRRLSWRNSRNLYKRNCDLCKKEFLTVYAPNTPYTVYCHDCYYSDRWDPTGLGMEFDFNRPFFEQFDQLMKLVPHPDTNNQDCDGSAYVNACWKTTNSYLCFGSDICDQCFYCTDCYNCRVSFNCYMSFDLELSSYCVDCSNGYNIHYSQECDTVRDSYFCFDVRGSNNCFGSAGLRNKEYYIFNKPIAADKWSGEVQKLFVKYTVDELYQMAEKAWNVVPRKASIVLNSEGVTGDHIQDSKNAQMCFDAKSVTDVKYITHSVPSIKDCMDSDNTGAGGELMYQFINGYGYNVIGSCMCYNVVRDISYCFEVQSSHDCFGSIGLRKQQYCILNKAYSASEYRTQTKKIIEHMRQTGEWGEFFPISVSPFAYNETEAQMRFPLNQSTAEKNNFRWKSTTVPLVNNQLPVCDDCGKNYKVIEQEVQFLSDQSLPQPNFCPDCRFQKLFQRRNPYQLWQRQCMCTQPTHQHEGRCTTVFETTYSPDRKELVYCENCYQREIL